MAIDISCDLAQGFNFRKDAQAQIGFITSLKIGDVKLDADIELVDPENNANKTKVVGVASYVSWTESATDHAEMVFQVCEDAKNKLDTLTKKNMSNIEVEFKFDCYNYDTKEGKYFKNFHTNDKAMEGILAKNGEKLELQIQVQANMMVQEPRNYMARIQVKPQPKAQEMHYASSVSDKLVLAWGRTVG
jgi:hypothetical protein